MAELMGMTKREAALNQTYFTALDLVKRWQAGKIGKPEVIAAVNQADAAVREKLTHWVHYHHHRAKRGEKL